jgi:hypothetical protein
VKTCKLKSFPGSCYTRNGRSESLEEKSRLYYVMAQDLRILQLWNAVDRMERIRRCLHSKHLGATGYVKRSQWQGCPLVSRWAWELKFGIILAVVYYNAWHGTWGAEAAGEVLLSDWRRCWMIAGAVKVPILEFRTLGRMIGVRLVQRFPVPPIMVQAWLQNSDLTQGSACSSMSPSDCQPSSPPNAHL